MTSYFDTSILAKLYVPERDSEAIRVFVVKRGKSIAINSLQKTELANAFTLKAFRREISNAEMGNLLEKLDRDISRNRLTVTSMDWLELWKTCSTFSREFSNQIGCRTLDIMHVAAAKIMDCSEFFTNDKRQKELAEAVEIQAYLYPALPPVT